jgi:hypothetical protein
MPAAARQPKPKTVRELCEELLEIERDNPKIFARIDEIKMRLKLEAEAVGAFRENFAKLGWVSASPPKAAEVTGEAPAIDVGAWSALKPSRREKLLEEGWVKLEPIVKGASYGQVRTKLHAQPKEF